jgi:hypothetical protein
MQNKIDEKFEFSEKTRVWIGDPCYVISDQLWHEVCNQIFAGTNREVNHLIKFEFRDLRKAGVSDEMLDKCAGLKLAFIQCGTEYGDGTFDSDSGFKYGVDAGCLGAVPEYMVDPEKREQSERLGKFFEVSDFIRLCTDGEGKFMFSDAKGTFEIIDTGGA